MALRLTLIITTVVAAALSSLAAAAQPAANLPQVGYLGTSFVVASPFVDTLTALGYVDGQRSGIGSVTLKAGSIGSPPWPRNWSS